MQFDVISLLPHYFDSLTQEGVIARAYQKGLWSINVYNPRDFSDSLNKRIDDRPYGGGPGMVINYEPLKKTYQKITQITKAKTIYLSPTGQHLDHKVLCGWLHTQELEQLILICGRYEGIDQRFIDEHVDEIISIGDFVLSGGELPALCLIDALVRLLPNVLGNADSSKNDSFSAINAYLLDCPHYTRPEKIKGLKNGKVPEVLLSGNHTLIQRWREWQSLVLTAQHRSDLMTSENWERKQQLDADFNKRT